MKIKLFLLLLCTFILSGCSVINLNNMSIDDTVSIALDTKKTVLHNENSIGFRYYLPRGFTVLENKNYNQTLLYKQNKYYLFVDLVSFHNKETITHTIGENNYYYKEFEYNNLKGYLYIRKKSDYFLVEMMYNYAIIEVVVEEHELKDTILNASFILSSINYNEVVISNLVGENKLDSKETKYSLPSPEVENDKNFLDYVNEYDKYQEATDTDIIQNSNE